MNTAYAQISCGILDCFSYNDESAFEDSGNVDWIYFDIDEDCSMPFGDNDEGVIVTPIATGLTTFQQQEINNLINITQEVVNIDPYKSVFFVINTFF